VVVWWLLPVCRQPRALFFALSLVCATAVAWLIHVVVEKPVARLRDVLRARPGRMA
jgi:peptidoglycan/LPS O-acetylase OafA/YrhL